MVITKFNLYENVVQYEPIAVCIPSGEVIYLGYADIDTLRLNGYLFKIRVEDEYYRCSDYHSEYIKQHINKNINTKPIVSLSRTAIMEFLEDCGLLKDQYRILDDLSIDAMGPVNMSNRFLKRIPYKFNRCTSDFICSDNELSTLENTPLSVHGNFNCSFNKLHSLEGGPKMVSRGYNCSYNTLTTLKGAPMKLNFFNCSHNFLNNLNYAPEVVNSDNFIKNDNYF
jgi:hypothetical protein